MHISNPVKIFRNLKLRKRYSKKHLIVFGLVFGLIGGYFVWNSFAARPNIHQAQQFIPDRVLVTFKPGVSNSKQAEIKGRYNLSELSEIPQIGVKVLKVNPKALDAVVKALSHNPAVQFVEKDYLADASTTTPNDPYYYGSPPAQYSGNNAVQIYQWPFTTTKTNQLWDTTTGSTNTIVAVLDSRFETSLEDAGTFVSNWNVADNNADVTIGQNHGVFVSGVVNARTNNAVGVASTCWNCRVMGVKITSGTNIGATYSNMAKGMTYAADNGAKIINVSFAGTSPSSTLRSAEQYAQNKGLLIVAAAGNEGCDCMRYPAADPGVIGVSMLSGSSGTSITSGNYGQWVKIAAPSGVQTTTGLPDTPYGPGGGTSIASPFVAGVAGLLWSAKPDATAEQIQQALFSSTQAISGTKQTQNGRIDSYNALQHLMGTPSPEPDTVAPVANITAPSNGSEVSGGVSIDVSATDNVAVTKVELYRNGILYATSSSLSSFFWDTTTVANGSYSFYAKAYDAAGNIGTSPTVTYTVNNSDRTAPSANITAPTSGTTLAGVTRVVGSASDNIGVTSTDLYIDGVFRASSPSGTLNFDWNTQSDTNGSHTLVLKAYDAAGNTGSSATITVNVSNSSDTQAPTVVITAPADNSYLSERSVTITASSTDNIGVTKTELYIDGALKATVASSLMSYKWNINKQVKNGSHTITVKAYDAAGNIGSTQIQVIK